MCGPHTGGLLVPLEKSWYTYSVQGISDGTREWGRTCEVIQKALNMGHHTYTCRPHTEIPSFQHMLFAVEFLCCLLHAQRDFRTLQRSYPVNLRVVVLRKISSWCPIGFLVIYRRLVMRPITYALYRVHVLGA